MNIMEFISTPQVIISLAVLIVLLWRISIGYRFGLVSELIEIASLAVGFVIFTLTAGTIGKIMHGENLHIFKTIIQLAIVVSIYRVITGIAKGTKGSGKVPILSSANKVLGACFGAIETYMWVMLIQHIVGYKIDSAISFTISKIISCIRI
ncbi:CvpA family protein [Butyrivibrio sp. XPD2002]|uniref:CvpA family protein n=1 Tax=Butyrivibrio sp. XPD2002 TaxID=1280665 RepID=UPI0003FEF603|nr:CvpA family protein [Butyrivibrio sp. XPD2002]